jgi:ATP adenylyltransferase/5',5'''-P-1,P-4-tetraphosphate phosphorylase II
MMEKEYTEGPWEIPSPQTIGAYEVIGDAHQLVALVYGESHDKQEANACLISAAPDLLEALQHVDILMGEPDDTLDYQALIGRRMLEMWPRIQAVINKAKGQ